MMKISALIQLRKHTAIHLLCCLAVLSMIGSSRVLAQTDAILGEWHFNRDLSDSTDRQVEAAMRAAGQRVQRRLFDRSTERYRGGPEDHELYDHISYDLSLTITEAEDHYLFTYGGYSREVFTDNRARTVSLSALGEVSDFSLGHWEGDELLVEARPRDGGFTQETYRLINGKTQLEVEMYIKPRSFTHPIELTRVYDRAGSPQ